MAEFTYLLSYNANLVNPNHQQLQVFISQNRDIETWYLAFVGTYVIKSDRYLSDLRLQFAQIFGGTPFILTFVPARHATGSLPPEIWQWLNDEQNPTLPES